MKTLINKILRKFGYIQMSELHPIQRQITNDVFEWQKLQFVFDTSEDLSNMYAPSEVIRERVEREVRLELLKEMEPFIETFIDASSGGRYWRSIIYVAKKKK